MDPGPGTIAAEADNLELVVEVVDAEHMWVAEAMRNSRSYLEAADWQGYTPAVEEDVAHKGRVEGVHTGMKEVAHMGTEEVDS